jgi:hypothetical protein
MSTYSTNTNATCNNSAQLKPPFSDFNFTDTDCLDTARKNVNGILAPEPSFMPPPQHAIASFSGAASNINEESKDNLGGAPAKAPSQDSACGKEVLDHMARLDFNVDTEKGGTLISFHIEYQDYLDENYLIDQE